MRIEENGRGSDVVETTGNRRREDVTQFQYIGGAPSVVRIIEEVQAGIGHRDDRLIDEGGRPKFDDTTLGRHEDVGRRIVVDGDYCGAAEPGIFSGNRRPTHPVCQRR